MPFFRLSIVTKVERNMALSQIRDCVSAQGGWITDHSLFSNRAATLNVEMPLAALPGFMAALNEAGFTAKTDAALPAGETGDCRGSLSITFIHGDPDLKQAVPPFG
ncbi:hypothetical protein NBZ79_15450 [Sneathiella marina]|uniref:HMA domain-containing protein n=1 Tax=Sneathiella marina TaxID=2950108 RepID=A0ABY4W053_9PROT|nr:hypothetical protein [Sneathiella marina]USG60561.1 hypothetical protein NBZ79_15450 [Sneathiella marina]